MIDIITEKDMDMYMAYYNVKDQEVRKNRIMYAVLFAMLGILIGVMNPMGYFITPLLAYAGMKIPYIRLRGAKKKQDVINSYAFPEFLQSFLALVNSSGNIYQTLKETVPYVDEPLRSELEKLINLINYDNRREFYMEFADYIGTTEAYMVMDMIYQFSVYGNDEKLLREVSGYIRGIQENKVEEIIESKMAKMDNVGLIPIFIVLFAVAGFTVVIYIHFMQFA